VQICTGKGVDADDYLGNECAGAVTNIGIEVCHLKVGNRAAALCRGSFATVVVNPGNHVRKIPNTMSYAAAAMVPFACHRLL